ncbi:unnamed protein product [Notodromas monacha]|uniref:Uncharacterized protein n=1 Tax=Notodromas monacha TaxID=399045 RepID=A0A7R9G854_9CRUS|nr:unnamed protein product [Notodromas monacha]CAG0912771.1 unnamed protein product [Notodromas monacha]
MSLTDGNLVTAPHLVTAPRRDLPLPRPVSRCQSTKTDGIGRSIPPLPRPVSRCRSTKTDGIGVRAARGQYLLSLDLFRDAGRLKPMGLAYEPPERQYLNTAAAVFRCSEDGKVLLNTSLNGMDNVGQLFVQDLPPLSQQQQQQQMRTTTTMTRNTNIIISNDDEDNNNHHQHQASMMMRMSDCSSRSIIRSNHSACCTGLPEVIQFLMKDHPSVLVLGGMNPMMGLGFTAETASYVLQYFPHLERWWGITRLPEPRVHFAAVFFDGCVYVVGGAVPLLVPDDGYNTKATPSQKCWRFHPSQGTWDMLSDMPEARMHHSLLVFRGKIYVIGGIGSDNQLSAAVYYALMWIEGPGLQCPRGFLQVAHTEQKLFIIGGAGRQQSSASTASSTGATPCGPSPSAATNSHNKDQQHKQRSRLPSSALHQLLSSRMHAVSTVDVWDNDTEDWVFDLEMDVPCHGHAVVALGGEEFLVIGGMTCKSAHVMQRVAKFNATNRKWHQLQPLPYGLTGHAAVLLPPIAPSSRRRCN